MKSVKAIEGKIAYEGLFSETIYDRTCERHWLRLYPNYELSEK